VRRRRHGLRGHGGTGGTKLAGNAADKANRTLEKLEEEVAEILRQAAAVDRREDQLLGDAGGDELPPALASKAGRLDRLRQAKALLEAEAAARQQRHKQRVAAATAAARAKGKPPRQLKPWPCDEAPNPRRRQTADIADPDSRFLRTRNGSVQGDNAQAVTTGEQVIVAAELTQDANDLQQLQPMLKATAATLAAAGIAERSDMLLVDSGYWSIANLTTIEGGPELLIPPAKHARQGKPRQDGKPSASNSHGLRAAMQSSSRARRPRPATRSGRRPSSRSSARSRTSAVHGGCCAAGQGPAASANSGVDRSTHR
jgi:hypothetical protein